MRRGRFIGGGLVVAIAACDTTANRASATTHTAASDTVESFASYAAKVKDALGEFNDITVFRKDSSSPAWHLVSGQYVPVTVDGKTPVHYANSLQSDRPMMLPTAVQGFDSGGQSAPYSAIGRMPGSNPEVQWIWVVRQYTVKDTTDPKFPWSGDMAVIGHHPRTGATTYLQFYRPAQPKSGVVVVSPFSAGADTFWSPLKMQADSFKCARCHAAGPFIHTPWINQVTISGQPIVPSDPLGPFFIVDSKDGELFASWDSALVAKKGGGHLNRPANTCTQCHRVGSDMIGLNENSTRYTSLDSAQRNSFSVRSDSFQTAKFVKLPWMPPADPAMIDFYAGQRVVTDSAWRQNYGPSATLVNRIVHDIASWRSAHDSGWIVDIPRPPVEQQTIMVNRALTDTVPAKQSLWIVDSRMRANTDGVSDQWRFVGATGADSNVMVAPVVYRRKPTGPSTIVYEVAFVGAPRKASSAQGWVPVGDHPFQMRLGDYLGVVFINGGPAKSLAIIPHSDDEWAKLKRSDGTTWLRDGSITYRLASPVTPAVGTRLSFNIASAGFLTYSFEFKNKL
jgi:hypothetical protein